MKKTKMEATSNHRLVKSWSRLPPMLVSICNTTSDGGRCSDGMPIDYLSSADCRWQEGTLAFLSRSGRSRPAQHLHEDMEALVAPVAMRPSCSLNIVLFSGGFVAY